MTRGSEFLLYLPVLGPLAVLLVGLLAIGPLGWFVVGFLVLGGMANGALTEDDEERTPDRTMSSTRGSPNSPDRETCRHCGDPL